MHPTKFRFIWQSGFRGEDFLENQKQELLMVAIFVNGSGRHEQSQQRTFHRCFLPSFGSFGRMVSEEKNLIFSIVFYILLIFFTNFQVWEAATAMFDGSRGHHSWSERELYIHCSFIVWWQHWLFAIFKELNKSKKSILCNDSSHFA
jgi:hypothetical protein